MGTAATQLWWELVEIASDGYWSSRLDRRALLPVGPAVPSSLMCSRLCVTDPWRYLHLDSSNPNGSAMLKG